MDILTYSRNIQNKSDMFSEVMLYCRSILINKEIAKEAKEYLDNRLPKYVPGFGFGYFPDNYNLNLLIDVFPELRKLGIIYDINVHYTGVPQKMTQSILSDHNLIMPYKNLYGDIIGLVGRTLKPDYKEKKLSKYKNTQMPKGLSLFGLYNARKEIVNKNSVIIVEGQFDCITCHRFGINNVVALGSAGFTKYQLFMLLRYTNNINLLLDSDDAGIKAVERIYKLNEVYGNSANIKRFAVPEIYKDIDEFFIKDEVMAKEFMKCL